MKSNVGVRIVALCIAIGLVAAACGDDDDSATSEDTTESTSSETTVDTSGGEVEEVAFCTSGPMVDEVLGQDEPDPEEAETVLAQAEADAPEAIAESVTTAASTAREVLATGNFDLFEDDAFTAAIEDINGFYVSDCGFADVGFTAVEYMYDNVPDEIAAGPTVLELDNNGTEVHEAFIGRINDGVELSAEELLALPEDEGESMVTQAAFLFQMPGTSGSAVTDLEPGRYLIACFIPVGTTPEALPEIEAAFESGEELPAPHFTEGMWAEFEVA